MSAFALFEHVQTPPKRARIEGVPATYRGQPVIPRAFRGSSRSRPMTRYARSRTRTRLRRRPRRQRRRGIIRRRIPRSLVPTSKLVRAVGMYSGTSNTTADLVPVVPINVRCQNINDPSGTESNVQPLGYDQWAAFYNRAKVVSCKVTLTVHNASSKAIVYGLQYVPENGDTALSPWEHKAEAPGNIHRLLSPDVDHGTISMIRRTKKDMNIKDLKDCDDVAVALDASSTGPNRNTYISCWVANHSTSTAGAFDWTAKVEYIILLDQYKVPDRSTHV